MQSPRDGFDLTAELRSLRPTPRPEFSAQLDARANAAFPPAPRAARPSFPALANRLRSLSPQRWAFASGGVALLAIVVATAVIAANQPGHRLAVDVPLPHRSQRSQSATPEAGTHGPRTNTTSRAAGATSAGEGSTALQSSALPVNEAARTAFAGGAAAHLVHRDVERSAEIGLLADPADVDEDSAKVFSAVHDAHGIVLRSTTTTGKDAGAHFELLIPSARLGDALAAFSAIDEVRTRHEATTDITAPTAAVGERLQDSRAKIDGLLSRLAAAETESEAAAIEVELHEERGRAARLRSHLTKLRQRVAYTRVELRIEAGASSSSGGGWGIDDAFGDAGHILGVAAGVTLIGLAVLAPLALLCLLAWLASHAWLRVQRGRALRDA